MATRCYLVTEGSSDEALLRRVFAAEIASDQVAVTRSSGSAAAASTGRTILVVRQAPVVLVVDADSNDEDQVEEKRDFLEEALRAASPGIPFRVVLAVPEMEAVFFEDPQVLTSVGLAQLSPVLAERAKYQPKRVLLDLLKARSGDKSHQEWVASLSDEAVESLRKSSLFKQVLDFVQESVASSAH